MKYSKIEHQKIHSEKISKEYYAGRQDRNHVLYKKLLWEYFLKNNHHLLELSEISCLEPMCGFGGGYEIIENSLAKKLSYSGFDYSEELVKISNENNPKLNIKCDNVLTFNSKEKVDIVILIGGLHHVYENTVEALENISKCIKIGGYFINFEPTQNNMLLQKIRDIIYKKSRMIDDYSEQAFFLEELNLNFRKSGFKLIDQIYPGLLGYILYYNPDAFPFLNIGNRRIVKMIFNLEKRFFKRFVAKKCSFTTMSIWEKQ